SSSEQVKQTSRPYEQVAPATGDCTLPLVLDQAGCTDDTWTATSITNVPTGRFGHTAVWTGTEMIVWAGIGGRYNPATNSWTPTSATNAPTVRYLHTAVWTGSEMIVWGGFDGFVSVLNTGGRYNPNTNSWTSTSIINAPAARTNHT